MPYLNSLGLLGFPIVDFCCSRLLLFLCAVVVLMQRVSNWGQVEVCQHILMAGWLIPELLRSWPDHCAKTQPRSLLAPFVYLHSAIVWSLLHVLLLFVLLGISDLKAQHSSDLQAKMPPPLQQLLRGSYRTCQALSGMHTSVQTLRLLHQHPGTSVLGRQQRPKARTGLCAHKLQTIAHSSRSTCSSKQPLVNQVQHWGSSSLGSSSSSSRRGHASSGQQQQHVCHASSGSTPQPAEPSGSGTVSLQT